jgi:hypothetical protein
MATTNSPTSHKTVEHTLVGAFVDIVNTDGTTATNVRIDAATSYGVLIAVTSTRKAFVPWNQIARIAVQA